MEEALEILDRENQGATAGQLKLWKEKLVVETEPYERSWMTVTTITTRFRKAGNKGGAAKAAVADTEQNRIL